MHGGLFFTTWSQRGLSPIQSQRLLVHLIGEGFRKGSRCKVDTAADMLIQTVFVGGVYELEPGSGPRRHAESRVDTQQSWGHMARRADAEVSSSDLETSVNWMHLISWLPSVHPPSVELPGSSGAFVDNEALQC